MNDLNNTPDPDRHAEPELSIWLTWSRFQLLGLFFVLMLGDFAVQIVVYELVGGWFGPAFLGAILGVLVPLILLQRLAPFDLRRDLALQRPAPLVLVATGLLAAGALVPTSLLAELSLYLHPADPQWARELQDHLPTTPVGYALVFLSAGLVGPLAEELIFRGVLQQLAARTWGRGAGIVISALVFGIVHGQPWLLLGLLGIGLVLAFVFATTDSLLACWLAHAVHNTLSLALMISAAEIRTEPALPTTGDWVWCAVSLLVLVAIGRWLWRTRPGQEETHRL